MKPYQEADNSTVTSNGKTYHLNTIWKAVYKNPILEIEVSKISWIIPFGTPDEKRVKQADLSKPLLITEENGKEIVLDGFHRLVKARRDKVKKLPYWRVTPEVLKSALIEIRKESFQLDIKDPSWKNWV